MIMPQPVTQSEHIFLVVFESIRAGERLPARNEYFTSLCAAKIAAQNGTRFLSRKDRDVAKVYMVH